MGRKRYSQRRSPVPDDVVRQQVGRISASREFCRSTRLKSLLAFIVETTLKGETSSLKEWVIGKDVYDRGIDFDPRLDPIVRTESRRLRRKLSHYYETEGREDPLVIEVPKGSYVPDFRDHRDSDLCKLPGETIGAYFVLDRFDGGFDTVTYRVRENPTERVFTLKVIAGPARPEARQALEADVVAASALWHNNICHVHGLEHSGRNICIVTGDFEGESVAGVVDGSAPTWDHTLEIARQFICGLAAAHRLHIVHGNLNPSNVLVAIHQASGTPLVKIADFGARSLVRPPAMTGDNPQPSPEQCDGASADERSDVWSAGAVLCKLLTGSMPESQINPIAWRDEVPGLYRPALAAVLARCLAANPADRYADAMELEGAFALVCPPAARGHKPPGASTLQSPPDHAPLSRSRRPFASAAVFILIVATVWGASWFRLPNRTVRCPIGRLAVLPVECPSGNQECRMLGRALTDSLNSGLTKMRSLAVVPVDASPQFKARKLSLREIGARLNADHLLTGTIEKPRNTWQFTARIIRVKDQALEWTGRFECSWNNLSDIQSQLFSDLMSLVSRGASTTMRGAEEDELPGPAPRGGA